MDFVSKIIMTNGVEFLFNKKENKVSCFQHRSVKKVGLINRFEIFVMEMRYCVGNTISVDKRY